MGIINNSTSRYVIQAALVLLLACFTCLANSESGFNVHPLYLEQDYRADYSNSVVSDALGFLWIATDNGLMRYDGYKLKRFEHQQSDDQSLSGNAISALFVSDSGDLWVGSQQLNLYQADNERFVRFDVSSGRRIDTVFEDSQGHLWLGGQGFGLLRFNSVKEEVEARFFVEGVKSTIYKIVGDADGVTLWVAGMEGLYLFNTENEISRKIELPHVYGRIHDMSIDKNGALWVVTDQGVYVVKNKREVELFVKRKNSAVALSASDQTLSEYSAFDKIISVLVDSRNDVWLGTENSGVYLFNTESGSLSYIPSSVSPEHTFPIAPIHDMHEDADGSVWFSAGWYGVYRISKQFETFSVLKNAPGVENSLGFNNVQDLLESRDGVIWVSTLGRGLDRFDPEVHEFTHYRHNPHNNYSLSSDTVTALAEDMRGNIWVGTHGGGLNKYDIKTNTFERIRYDTGLSHNTHHISRIVVDEGNIVLAISGEGLHIYNPKTKTVRKWDISSKNAGIKNAYISDILPIVSGAYWLAGEQGLELFDSESGQSKPVSLADIGAESQIKINQILEDAQNVLWMASSIGLIQYSPMTGRAVLFSRKDGLVDNYLSSIEEDGRGYYWLGTRNGISRFNPRSQEFVNFRESDGLASSQHNELSSLRSESGMMYFGGVDGVSVFDPKRLLSNDKAPKVHVTHFEIYQNHISPRFSDVLKKSIIYTNDIELEYHQRDIAFEFSALNFIFPANNEYRYRLQGLEDEWVRADSHRRRVRYTNLEPGKYVFQVLGSNNDGVWAGKARSINVIIYPAWWQTIWAKVIFSLLIVSVIYAFIGWRVHANKRRERELKKIVEEQTAELKKVNQSTLLLNAELEQRVEHRTRELSVEIEERRVSEARSQHLAFHDSLTGLPNRTWQINYLNELIEKNKTSDTHFAVLFIGGDRFKQINDNYGHLLGDKLLVAVSRRIVDLLEDECHASRLGSDEFAVTIDNIESEEALAKSAKRFIEAFEKPFDLDDVKLHFYASIGMLLSSNEYGHATQVLRNANIALRKAKEQGRGTCQMFDSQMLKHTLEIAALEADLKEAIKKDQLFVVYQPIIEVATGELASFEILLRWRHPDRGLVAPDKFIPIAEAMGVIFEMGLWVLRQACLQLKAWEKTCTENALPNIAVNISAIQLSEPGFLVGVEEVLASTGADKQRIKFEITESAIMEQTESVDGLLESLREGGFELAIDDFGTGYSSLSYLDKLPVQLLKIDRSFVSALTDNSTADGNAHEIVRATISLAHNLKMRVVAEGIENEAQMEALKRYGCDFGQGYMIAKPLSAEAATDFLLKSKH